MAEPLDDQHHWNQEQSYLGASSGRARKQGRRNRRYRNFSDFIQEEAHQKERLRVDTKTSSETEPNVYDSEDQIQQDRTGQRILKNHVLHDPGNSTSEESTIISHQSDVGSSADIELVERFPCKVCATSKHGDLNPMANSDATLIIMEHELKPKPIEDDSSDHDSPVALGNLHMANFTESQEGIDLDTETDPSPSSAGSGPLRGLGGFPTQQPQQSRNAPLGSGRLQNTNKIST